MPTQNNKQENFEAISPQKSGPMIISRNTQKPPMFGRLGWIFLILFLITAGALWYSNKQLSLLKNPSTSQSVKGETVLEKISRHVLLPAGEVPHIATINSAQALQESQAQYPGTKMGDQLVTYSNVEVVYNPSLDIVVYARPIPLAQQATSTSSSQATSTPVAVATETRAVQGVVTLDIRNGSGIPGTAAKIANTFSGVSGYQVKNVTNAKKSNYKNILLVNLTGKNIAGLEKQFKTTAVTVLPAGEAASSADVVIIVGR